MKTGLAKFGFGLLLLGGTTTAGAQTTWNYFISDGGGGNSLVTWNVTGSLATPPGSVLMNPISGLAVSVNAPGIYADSYSASGIQQSIPAADGSYFQLEQSSVYFPIVAYDISNAPGNGNDTFGLFAPMPPRTGPGVSLVYIPGTQSALIPVDFSNFNPGTYQSEESEFNTTLTVNLTVEAVPEPSTLAVVFVGGLSLVRLRRRE